MTLKQQAHRDISGAGCAQAATFPLLHKIISQTPLGIELEFRKQVQFSARDRVALLSYHVVAHVQRRVGFISFTF